MRVYLEEQNATVYIPRGLFITDPIERGLRVIEISFLRESATNSASVGGVASSTSQQPVGHQSPIVPANLVHR